MKAVRMLWPKLLLFFLIFTAYRWWFISPEIIGGDWPYYYPEFLREFSLYPRLWAPWQGNGIGGVNPLLGLYLFSSSLIVPFTQWLQLSWVLVYKIGWFGLFLLLAASSSWVLAKTVFRESFKPTLGALGSLIFLTNTYILMLTSGGQMGVALAYAMAPLVLSNFMTLANVFTVSLPSSKFKVPWPGRQGRQSSKLVITAGLVLALQIMFDPRIAYVTLLAALVYFVVTMLIQRPSLGKTLVVSCQLSVVVLVSLLLNAFWLLPMVMMRSNPLAGLGSAYTSIDSLKFFSFADFSHAVSLLHPNWPENIFGKTYFLQPEFLLLPIMTFGSLLFLNVRIIFFALLGLLGAFLAKGVNPPFGEVYGWLFEHFPGFVMFRDPTKFYLLTTISYSILIPISLTLISERLKSITKYLILVIFLLFWLSTIRQAFSGQLSGTFAKREVPPAYGELKDFLDQQPEFFRTLWVPRLQRFAPSTSLHMSVEAQPLFNATNAAELSVSLAKPETPELLAQLGIKYVIIPFDSLGELFLQDRKYDDRQRQEYEKVLDQIMWLAKIKKDKLTIYTTPSHKDCFWLEAGEILTYQRLDPADYVVTVEFSKPTTLFFSESYHPGWKAKTTDGLITAQRTKYGLNSFRLEKPGNYTLKIYFAPQKYVNIGGGISLVTLFTSFGLLIWFSRRGSALLPK
ncbi:MAG: hypothetical protein ACOY0S_01680 [Patescibacteria group bacterium]